MSICRLVKLAFMIIDFIPSFTVAHVVWSGRFLNAGRLPGFRGATLRGALGYHLRNTVCHSFQRKCTDCFLRFQCAYSLFFEGTAAEERKIMRLYDNTPQPFMFLLNAHDATSVKSGDLFVFGMRIFGNATELFPYVAFSLFEAGKKGIGQEHLYYETDAIYQGETILYAKGETTIRKPQRRELAVPNSSETAKIATMTFLSPLRIRSEGHTAKHLSFLDIAKAALRRITILNAFFGDGSLPTPEWSNHILQLAERVPTVSHSISPYGFDRYSGRQKRSVHLDGVLGDIVFRDVPPELLRLLKIMEGVGLGKSTSFGFGRIAVQVE